MKICFNNADDLLTGINIVSTDLGFTIVDSDADLTVDVFKVDNRIVKVCLDGNNATITYGDGKARFFRGLATLLGWVKDGITKKQITQTPLFSKNGAMADVSSGNVLKVSSVKTMLRCMALMGLSTYMLYTEDTYEIENRPYFGHMRGRYTKQELKELDGYALALGIELIPCIQVLGHLQHYLRQSITASHRDTERVLLAGTDETYDLIDDMLKTVAECFTTKRVHIGMDETHDLGRGNYLDKYGYRKQQDIYFEHINKVKEIANKYNLKPMIWSDMFFRLAGKGLPNYREYDTRVEFSDEVKSKIPQDVIPVFWDYYRYEYDFYATNINKHRDIFNQEPIWAGGVWCWSSYCPLFSRSFDYTYPALDACKDTKLQEIVATIWGIPYFLSLAGLAWYADYDYLGYYDENSLKRCFRYACQEDYDTIMLTELPEHPDGQKFSLTNILAFNDPLLGFADKHFENLNLKDYYVNATKTLQASSPKNDIFKAQYQMITKLSHLLELKADFGIRAKDAYDKKDYDTLKTLILECDEILKRLQALRNAHYDAWMQFNKPQGWEFNDYRYGGLTQRFYTVKDRLSNYIDGKLDVIEELAEPRLRIDGCDNSSNAPLIDEWTLWASYTSYTFSKKV